MRSLKEDERLKARAERVEKAKKNVKTRRKPKSVQDEADAFVAAILQHFASTNVVFNKKRLADVPILFRNYSANTGLRGDHKTKVWANVRRQLDEAKAAATSDDAEL